MSLAALALATVAAATPVKLAAPGFQSVNVRVEVAQFFSNDFTNRMRDQGLEVISAQDISVVLGIERQKQLMGCDDESSCVTELAEAFGVDGVITGSLGYFEGNWRILINVVSSATGKPLATFTKTVATQKQVGRALAEAAATLASEVFKNLNREPVTAVAKVARPSQWGFIASGAALAFAGAGAGLFIASSQADALLKCDAGQPCAATQTQARAAHDRGQLLQSLGIGAFAAAAACTGVALWLFLRPDDAKPVALQLWPGGLGLFARF